MKRPLIITIGIVIIVLVLAVWVYLMLYGTPEEQGEVFTNLGFDLSSRDVAVTEVPPVVPPPIVDTDAPGLQQLTTRPVAGFIVTEIASSTVVRYAEQGTGHVYEIDLASGAENLISRTTIPRVQEANFSPDGSVVALSTITGYNKDTFVGTISTTDQSITGVDLPPQADNIHVPDSDTVQYTWVQNGVLTGYNFEFITGELRTAFTLPFIAVSIDWGGDAIYAYNKPAAELLGYVYRINGGQYQTTRYRGYGLVMERIGSSTFTSFIEDDTLQSFANEAELPIRFIPEKCTVGVTANTLWCADSLDSDFTIDEWYRGEVMPSDALWLVDPRNGVATLALDIEDTINRALDVTDLTNYKNTLYFVNKIDTTLWQYTQ